MGMSENNLIISQLKVDYWLLMEVQSTAVISACTYLQRLMYVDFIADKN